MTTETIIGDTPAKAAEILSDPALSAGMALMIGQLLVKYGLSEFTMDSETFDNKAVPAVAFYRKGNRLTVVLENAPGERVN